MRESFVLHSEYIEDLPEDSKKEYLWYCYNYGINEVEPNLKGFELTVWTKIKRRIDTDRASYEEATNKKRLYNAKNHFNQGRATEEEKKLLSDYGFLGVLATAKENGNLPPYTDTNTRSVYVNDSVSVIDNVSVSDTVSVSEYVSDADVSNKRKYFLELWNKNADVLGMGMTIERPKDFSKFFENETVTKEYIKSGIDNFVQAVRSGKLDKRFIPSTPDRFVLKNTLERFQKPYSADGKRNAVYDADHRGEFAEAERI